MCSKETGLISLSKLRVATVRALLRTPTAVLAALLAGSVVGLTWFSKSLYLATGDVSPMRRGSVVETIRNLWNHQNSGAGGVSYEVARVWEHLFSALGDGIPWSGSSMGQRLFYVCVFGYGAWGLARLLAQYVAREWIVVFSSLAGVFSPYVAMQAPTPVPVLTIGLIGVILSEYVNVWRKNSHSAAWWCLSLLPASYACINPPLLALTMGVAVLGIPATALIERQDIRSISRGLLGMIPRFVAVVASAAWWLVPFVLTLSYARESGTLKAVTDVSEWSWTHRNSSLLNVLTQTANWGAPDKFYVGGASAYFQWPVRATLFVVPALLVAACVMSRARARRISILALSTYLVCVLLSKGLHSPFGWANEWLYREIPGFFLFREPFSKFGALMAVAGSLGLAVAMEEITERGGRKVSERSYTLAIIGGLVVSSLVVATHPVWLGTVTERTTQTKVSIPRNWIKAAGAVNESDKNGRALVVPLADFYQMPTVWGYYGIDSLPRQLINRPVLQRLPENYIADSQELEGLMAEVERAISVGDINRGGNILYKMGVSHLVVRRDYDYSSPYRKVAVSVTPDQYQAAAEAMSLRLVFDSPLVSVYEIGSRDGLRVGRVARVPDVTPEIVSILPEGFEALVDKDIAHGDVWVASKAAESVPFDGMLRTYSTGIPRWKISPDGRLVSRESSVLLNGRPALSSPPERMNPAVVALSVGGEIYGRGDTLSIAWGLKYTSVTPEGDPEQIPISAESCSGPEICKVFNLTGNHRAGEYYMEMSFNGEVESVCFKNLYGECNYASVQGGVARYVTQPDEIIDSVVVYQGSDTSNFVLTAQRVSTTDNTWKPSEPSLLSEAVRAGDVLAISGGTSRTIDLSEFTDCAGNKDVRSGGVRSLSGSALVISSAETRECSGIDIDGISPGSTISVSVQVDDGRVESCLFDHVADKCLDTADGAGVVSLESVTRYYSPDSLTLYIYTGNTKASIGRISVTEKSAAGAYVSRNLEGFRDYKSYWNWESGAGSAAVLGGHERVAVISEQYSSAWEAESDQTLKPVSVNGYESGWLLDGDQPVDITVRNSHRRTMSYVWVFSFLSVLLSIATRKKKRKK